MAKDYSPTTKPYTGKKQYSPTTKPYKGKKQYKPSGWKGKPFPEWPKSKTYTQWDKEVKAWVKANPKQKTQPKSPRSSIDKELDKMQKQLMEDFRPRSKSPPRRSLGFEDDLEPRRQKKKPDLQRMQPTDKKGRPHKWIMGTKEPFERGAARGGPVGYTQRWKTGRKS